MNLYVYPHPLMINSGTFWRCSHGHTSFNPCWWIGAKQNLREHLDAENHLDTRHQVVVK